jgi:uncharacterized membrane protein YkvA (DUF1232 family)
MIKDIWAQLAGAPLRVKVVIALGVLYLANPIDLIPDFIPVLGQMDDALVITLVIRYINKHVPDFKWEGLNRGKDTK